MSHACQRFWSCYKTITFRTLLARCRIPCTYHAKPHLNFQKCWKPSVFNTLDFLHATTACTCSASQLPKVPRHCDIEVFCAFLTWKCASRHNSVQLFISHLARWLRTRRFSEPTFQPSGAHWKNTVFRDFSNFSRACIIFLLTLSLLWSSFFFSSLLCFFPPLLFHLSILSEVCLLNFLRSYTYHSHWLTNNMHKDHKAVRMTNNSSAASVRFNQASRNSSPSSCRCQLDYGHATTDRRDSICELLYYPRYYGFAQQFRLSILS